MLRVRQKICSLGAALVISITLSGCGVVALFDTRPFADLQTSSSGKYLFLDTANNWEYWKKITDGQIEFEARGVAAPRATGGTWRSLWRRDIQGIREYRENPNKYINYIITSRRARGLPELN